MRSLEARGAAGCRPRDFRARTQAGVRTILRSLSGLEARRVLARLPHRDRELVASVARRPDPSSSRELPAELSHVWSRLVVASAFVLWSERRKSTRNGMRACVDGFTRGMFAALFTNAATGRAYSVSRLFATSYRAGERDHGACGAFVALERAGLWLCSQPRTCDANPRFIGPARKLADGLERRFAFAVRWLCEIPDTPLA